MKTQFKEQAEQCGICLEDIEFQGKIFVCSHFSCFKCIKKWSEVNPIQSENSCPICKNRFSSINKIAKRKEYKQTRKTMNVVEQKNQERIITHSEFIMLLQAASNILASELNTLLDFAIDK